MEPNLNKMFEQKKKRAIQCLKNINDNFKIIGESPEPEPFKSISRILNKANKEILEDLDTKEYIKLLSSFVDKVIDKLYKDGFENNAKILKDNINWVNQIRPIVIFDLDDTLRDATERRFLAEKVSVIRAEMKELKLEKGSKEEKKYLAIIDDHWNQFFVEGINDPIKEDMVGLLNKYKEAGFYVKIYTGASDKYGDLTREYLKNNEVEPHELKMRKDGVQIPDKYLKPSWVEKIDGADNVFAIYDDREAVNEYYHKKGVKNIFEVTKDFDVEKHFKAIQKEFLEVSSIIKPTEKKIRNKIKPF